jgi:secreted protein with Ig-like and vWFA domain
LGWGRERLSAEGREWYYDVRSNTESYAPIVENPFKSPMEEPMATLGIDVDTASYSNVQRFIEGGQWPPADAVRIEELLNSFTYDYPQPEEGEPFSVTMEVAACPWQPEHRLMRVGMQARDVDLNARPATSLVFLVDVSGSMADADKLPLVQQSLKLLLGQMTENDRLAIVTYRDTAQVALQSITGDRRDEAIAVVDSLHAEGSTNGAGGLELAYDVATTNLVREGQNRVIICTDGDFNVGESSDDAMVQLIEQKRETGVFLSVFGFGEGNLQDSKLEGIADHGNGQYAYINDFDQARRRFLDELTGTLYTVAKDVKLQVEFNPLLVRGYRMIGYENRVLAAEDFNNDRIDAGDVGAGHAVTALFEIIPGSSIGEVQPSVDPLRYQRIDEVPAEEPAEQPAETESREGASEQDPTVPRFYQFTTLEAETAADTVSELLGQEVAVEAKDATWLEIETTVENHTQVVETLRQLGEEPQVSVAWQIDHVDQVVVPADVAHELCVVKVRYKQPAADESVRREFPVDDRDQPMTAPSREFHWATAVAGYGMLVRQSPHRGDISWNAVIEIAHGARGDDADGRRAEFVTLAQQTRDLWFKLHGIDNSVQPVALDSTQARDRAACGGKYSNLLDKIEAPNDFATYGNFHDFGWWDGTEYQDHTGLPPAYWVYVQPHWYLWGEMHGDVTATPPPTFWHAERAADETAPEPELSLTAEAALAPPAEVSAEPIDVTFSEQEVSIEAIGALSGQNIGTLSLLGAQFDGAIIEGLRHTASIESLRLYGDGLSGQIPRLAHITGLTSLEIGAPLRLVDLEAISELGNLRHLKLPQDLAITVTGARNIAKLRGLTSLDLYNCQLDDASLSELYPLQQLTDLDLSLTQVSDAGLPTLTYFPHLKSLRLDRNWMTQTRVTDSIVPTLASLTELETLSLWGTQIGNDGLAQLAALPNLKSLSIGQSEITGEGLAALASSTVEHLTLSPDQIGTVVAGDPLLNELNQPILQQLYQRDLEERHPASPAGEAPSDTAPASPECGSSCDDSAASEEPGVDATIEQSSRPIGTTGVPLGEERWVIRFADTAEEAARQLDYFGIELGLLSDGKLIYLSQMSTTPTTREVTTPIDEERLFFGFHRERGAELFEKVGIDAGQGAILQFIPAETEALLARLERAYAGRTESEVRRTYFAVEQTDDGYAARVTRQVPNRAQGTAAQPPADEQFAAQTGVAAEAEPLPDTQAALDQIESRLTAQMPGLMHLREMPRLKSVLVIGEFQSQESLAIRTTLLPHVQWGFIDP